LLPDPKLSDKEIYAPNFKHGSTVILVRHPHGGTFEIPELTVNNSPTNKKRYGNLEDGVVINPKIAEKLSGADFDGDTALVIPNDKGKLKSRPALKELEGFDPNIYTDKEAGDLAYNKYVASKTAKAINGSKPYVQSKDEYLEDQKQKKMGKISNLITDMTIKSGNNLDTSEVSRAVKHSMVVIDSVKHNLDTSESEKENGIKALAKKYGGGTLISKSKRNMSLVSDANELSSGTAKENVYAQYANALKAKENEVLKEVQTIPHQQQNKVAAKIYAPEVVSLKAKLAKAVAHSPMERQAQIQAEQLVYTNRVAGADAETIKGLKKQAISYGRTKVSGTAKRPIVDITSDEWEAIQAGAVSHQVLKDVISKANRDQLVAYSLPNEHRTLSPSSKSRAQQLLDNGYTYAEVATAMGVSASTIHNVLSGKE
jgi:hypothetical protein